MMGTARRVATVINLSHPLYNLGAEKSALQYYFRSADSTVLNHNRIRRKNSMNECEQNTNGHNRIRKANSMRLAVDFVIAACIVVIVAIMTLRKGQR